MTNARATRVAQWALVVSLLGLVAAAALVVTSFVLGVDTEAGQSFAQTGSGLVVAFLVLVLVLSTVIRRLRRSA